MTEESKEVSFESLDGAIEFVDNKFKALDEQAKGYAVSFKELTGFMPDHRVNALDVVKIFNRMSQK